MDRPNLDMSLDEIIRAKQDRRRSQQQRHDDSTSNNNSSGNNGDNHSSKYGRHGRHEQGYSHSHDRGGNNVQHPSRSHRRYCSRSPPSSRQHQQHTPPRRVLGHARDARDHRPRRARLVVSNLHYDVVRDDLRALFETVGPVLRVFMFYDRAGRSNGVAEVTFGSVEDARIAQERFHNMPLDGLPMQIELQAAPLRSAGGNRNGNGNGGGGGGEGYIEV